jgi:hypothetical protein
MKKARLSLFPEPPDASKAEWHADAALDGEPRWDWNFPEELGPRCEPRGSVSAPQARQNPDS